MSAKAASKLAKGYVCSCGHREKFTVYVLAHWDDELVHTCEKKKKKNLCLRGRVVNMETHKRLKAL
jgi:hypothetical protein